MPLILNCYLLYLIIIHYLNISLYLFSKKSKITNNYAVKYRKTPCPVPPKRPQFCKIHEGGLDKEYKFYLLFLLKNE